MFQPIKSTWSVANSRTRWCGGVKCTTWSISARYVRLYGCECFVQGGYHGCCCQHISAVTLELDAVWKGSQKTSKNRHGEFSDSGVSNNSAVTDEITGSLLESVELHSCKNVARLDLSNFSYKLLHERIQHEASVSKHWLMVGRGPIFGFMQLLNCPCAPELQWIGSNFFCVWTHQTDKFH